MRIKKKGDYLIGNRMYVNAIRMYENALVSAKREENLGLQFEGEIYNNMAYAYLELFQMEEAAKYFKKAYENCRLNRFADSISIPAVCLWMRENGEKNVKAWERMKKSEKKLSMK